MKPAAPLFLSLLLLAGCHKSVAPPPTSQAVFDTAPSAMPLTPVLKEVSGIADSKTAPGHLWAEEDSGNPPQLWLIAYDGTVQKKVYLKGATNHGWEDMCRNGNDLYVGDFGDNNMVRTAYAIYKFAEPEETADTVYNFQKIIYQYPEGSHDADALLVDPATNDIYIITKQDTPSAIYKIAFPYSTTSTNTAERVGTLSYTGAVGAALSPDGTELLVKTYVTMYYYKRGDKSIEAALQTAPTILPYKVEPQGEAVTFAADNSGFFTLSEKALASNINLYFYKRR